MDSQRNILIVALIILSLMIWQTWKKDKEIQSRQSNTQIISYTENNNDFWYKTKINNNKKYIKINTDVLELTININGGDIEQALLLNYPSKLGSNEPFKLLETTSNFIYQAQSGLTGVNGPDNPINGTRPIYNVTENNFILKNNMNEIQVPMSYKDKFGNIFTKIFTLKRGQYTVYVDYIIKNNNSKLLELALFGQIKQSIDLPSYRNNKNNNFALNTFRGAAYSTHEEKYIKYKFNSISDNRHLNVKTKGGWVAMLQQYFVTAWIPDIDSINNFYTTNLGNKIVAIGYKSQPIYIQPGHTNKLHSSLWIGPEIQDKMAVTAPYLDLTVDYGWLWFISQPMFKLLKFIHKFIGNWGFSIITITLIIRSIMYPLNKTQYISMAKIRILQPKIQKIKETLGGDKQRFSQEMIALYKSEKVNPLGGCFPLIIQMPIFLALYYMLMNAIELRHASFVLWIHDLSSQDPYYILPILMGVTMYFIQKISPATINEPIQQKIIAFMPVVFTVFFLWFPSGLVLYYIINNILTIIQQKLIYYSLKKDGIFFTKK